MYPYRRLPDGGWELDTSLLFLIGIHTIVMGGVAAQHVQPCPRNYRNRGSKRKRRDLIQWLVLGGQKQLATGF